MKRISLETHGPLETIEFAQNFAKNLHGGEVLALHGDLGGGKTTFTKGLAEALRVEENITSPTFVILKNYQGKIQDPSTNSGQAKRIEFVHIDAYRSETIEDIKSVGIEDFLGRNDVVMVIEWAEKIKEILPANVININFKFIDENTREIEYDSNN